MNGLEFASPNWLYLLLIIPILITLYVFFHNKTNPSLRFSDTSFFTKLPRSYRIYLRHSVFALEMIALSLMIVAMARPQKSSVSKNVNVEGIDIMLAMDISSSMLACDLKPDRLEAAKMVASEFVEGRPDDRMGLVVFAGETYAQVPLTTDHGLLQNMIKDMSCGLLEDGTAIGDGLASAVNRLKDSEAISKVVILLTDGDNNRGSIDPNTAAELAKLYGIRVYTIGAGKNGTAPYPVQTPFGTIQYQQIPIVINEELLQYIANETGGHYYRATSKEGLEEIYGQIDKLERSKIEVTEFKRVSEEFYPFAAWALAALALALLLKNTVFRTVNE